jgi:hypothetical protein
MAAAMVLNLPPTFAQHPTGAELTASQRDMLLIWLTVLHGLMT